MLVLKDLKDLKDPKGPTGATGPTGPDPPNAGNAQFGVVEFNGTWTIAGATFMLERLY
jgi:hypothetical protein